jgi:Flp pilus assembly protein TadG
MPGPLFRKNRRGAAAVEFALVAPIMFTVVLGSIEFGRVMMALNLISNAARNGARVGVISGKTNSDVSSAVSSLLTGTGISTSNASTTILVNGTSADVSTALTGDSISVSVTVPVSSISWLAAPVFTNNMSLAQTSIMRHE